MYRTDSELSFVYNTSEFILRIQMSFFSLLDISIRFPPKREKGKSWILTRRGKNKSNFGQKTQNVCRSSNSTVYTKMYLQAKFFPSKISLSRICNLTGWRFSFYFSLFFPYLFFPSHPEKWRRLARVTPLPCCPPSLHFLWNWWEKGSICWPFIIMELFFRKKVEGGGGKRKLESCLNKHSVWL